MKLIFSSSALVVASAMFLAGSAAGQQTPSAASSKAFGTPAAMGARQAQASQTLGRIPAARIFRNASVATAGVALRNQRDGGISISGFSGPVKAAFIYWAAITQGAPNSAVSNIGLFQGNTGGRFVNIRGAVVGTGQQPCWSGDRITVFRGAIPRSLAVGNGFYRIRLRPGASGRTDGADPWAPLRPGASPPLPMFDGASIVMIGSGDETVALYDRGLSGRTFFPSLSYQLSLPVSARNATEVVFHNIGANGQVGTSIDVIPPTAREVTTIGNGVRIAGPGSPTGESDWNGGAGRPLPQLWDNTSRNITAEARRAGIGGVLPVSVQAPDDCLTPVANLVSIDR